MSVEQPKAPAKKHISSKDFRTIAVDTFGVRANDNIVQLMVGLESGDFQTGETFNIEEAVIVLTPRSLKVLSVVLSNAIAALESIAGPILLPEGKEEELKKTAADAISKMKK